MSNTEKNEPMVREIAHEAVALIDQNVGTHDSVARWDLVAGSALARLSRLLSLHLGAGEGEYELHALCACATVETWLTGHAALLLGEKGMQLLEERATDGQPSLEDLARLLDDTMYGQSEKPKAFRRHLRSFFDEIDIAGSEGSTIWLGRYVDDRKSSRMKTSPTTTDEPIDFVRVGLWVTLFLAHDYFATVGDPVTATAARALFDRLRNATDDFYLRRRSAATRPAP
ncbi:MAG TPA: hypothetical protein VM282_02040 [Acidimicrobiales bacterium]|nr:hypothetical protein [Acidimicrobiales bacterium]